MLILRAMLLIFAIENKAWGLLLRGGQEMNNQKHVKLSSPENLVVNIKSNLWIDATKVAIVKVIQSGFRLETSIVQNQAVKISLQSNLTKK